jgi:hypothetical protein
MATDDDLPAAPEPDDDRRAKDLDPAQLAELAAWFDLPSAQVYAEQQQRKVEESAEEQEWRENRERRDRACAAVAPEFLQHILRHEAEIVKPPPTVALTIDERKMVTQKGVHLELDRMERGEEVQNERSFMIPHDIAAAVAQNAPQAILRDLYRPVTEYQRRLESPFDELPDLNLLREAREVMRTNFKDIEWTRSGITSLDETYRVFREILSAPWGDLAEQAKSVHNAAIAVIEGR